MISESFVYWFTRLTHLHCLCSCIIGICILIMIVFLISGAAAYFIKIDPMNENERVNATNFLNFTRKMLVSLITICLMMCMVKLFVPTTKEMAAIYVIPKVVNNENIHNISNEMIALATEWMKELHPTNIINKASNK